MKQKLIIAIMLIMQLQVFAQLTYKTTWVANTGGTWQTFTQMYMNGVGLSKAGLVAGVTTWDEGGRGLGLYNSSDGSVKNTEWNDRWAGTCVGINLNFVYTAVGDYIAKRPISNTKSIAKSIKIPNVPDYTCEPIAFSSDGFTTDYNRKKMGITGASANEAFVVVAVYVLNKVFVYDTNLTLLREINIDRPFYGTADDNGNVWVIQGADADNVCKIVEFNTSGVATGKEINGLSDPRSLQVNASGQLVVGDNGANQQVFFYDITAAPSLVKTFGQKGGITAGIPGEVKPDKFNGIVYAGTDSLNNLFVITNREGAIIRKFNPDGVQQWQKYGLAFVDMADADPRNENHIYSSEEKYVMDYSKQNGEEQTYFACILNADKYPEDARINQSLDGGVWIRYINGKKFMFVGNMYRDFIFIYRFNSETDGEIAIPCGAIARSFIQDITEWPAYQPKVGSFIWRDLNGNGKFDQNEYQSVPYQISMANVDDVGNIYLAEGFDYFECQGLDEIGNPVYTFENKVTNAFPAPFDNVKKVVYDNRRDVMYITGNSKTLSNNYNVGPTFAAYLNWSKGNRTPAWIKNYNFDYNGFAAKNDYFFVAYSYTLNDCGIDVFKTSDGTKVGTFGTQQLDEFGWIDIPWGLMAKQRANGEYLVFREDDWVAKTVIQRWNPYSADADNPTKPLNLKVVSKTATSVTVSYNRATDATGLSGYFIYANNVKNNALTVWDTVYTITGLQANTDYNITVAAADYAGNETLSDIIQVKTFDTDLTKPDQPSEIVASNINYTSFSLKWNTASDNIGTIGYNVFLDNQKIGYKLIEDTTFAFTNLITSHQYQIKLVAYDYAGNVSDTSEIVNVTTLTDVKAPSTPILYASSLKSSSEIALTWASSTDNVYVEYYNLYKNGNLLQENIPAHVYMGIPINGESFYNYKITGLQSDSVYNLSVKGFDNSGNDSEFSNTVTVKTDSVWGRLLEIEESDMSHMEHILAYGRYFEASGFVAGMMKQEGYVEWTVDVPTDTLYRFITHYGSMETFPFNMQIDVNGVKQASFTLYTLPSMVSWMVFEDDPSFVIVRLKAGTNLIRLSSFSQYAPNLDFVKIMITAPLVEVTSVTLDSTSLSLFVNGTYQLTATVLPENADIKGVKYSTSSNAVATVSKTGLITAKKAGTATITVTTNNGGKTATCVVTVTAPTAIASVTNSQVKVYPNPANSQLFVELPINMINKGAKVQLFNSLSALVKTTGLLNANQNPTVIINTSDLSNGIYYLRIISNNTQISEKIVISK